MSWFNADKSFGFVKSEGGSDAFLHIRTLEAAGHSDVPEGARLQVMIEQSQRGPQVAEVLEVDASSAVVARQSSPPRSSRPPSPSGPEEQGEGTVKFFNSAKGFGFIGLDGSDKDVFVHAKTLERSGLSSLREGQRVSLTIGAGKKGPEARSVRIKA